jgi:hypothetical protein
MRIELRVFCDWTAGILPAIFLTYHAPADWQDAGALGRFPNNPKSV